MKSKRYAMLDSLRGLTLISMITYHAVWDMVYIFGEDWKWYMSDAAYVWQQSICWCFILLSGFCWSLGKKKWKRGLIVFVAGVIVSAVTLITMPENRILFGVLTLLGSSMLLMILLEKICKKVNPYIGIVVSFLIFLYCKESSSGHWSFWGVGNIKLPRAWYGNMLTAYLGFPPDNFFSADYFGIVPWFFLFVTGYFLYKIFERRQWLSVLYKGECKYLERLGKYSLIVYMLHQPLVYGVLTVIYGLK